MDGLGLSVTGSELVDWSWCDGYPKLVSALSKVSELTIAILETVDHKLALCVVALCNRDKISCSGAQREKSFPPCTIHILHQYTSPLIYELAILFGVSQVAILSLLGLFYDFLNIGETGGPSRLSTPPGPPRQKYFLVS